MSESAEPREEAAAEWTVRAFEKADTEAVVVLWEEAGLTRPWNDPHLDIERKLAVQPDGFLVATTQDAEVVGSVMAGYDGHRGWLYYLATASSHRGLGIARALVGEAERVLEAMGCPKVQLMVREGNEGVLGFYDSLGYERFTVLNTGKRLVSDQ
ncbi:GNAT family acetyltransferase [Microbacterium sp. NPDC055988]|uniref:GNAT family acetyltransferase n=1 Tax=Microbacterium sp. NPDC055988 TaxID=3345671 RepID=UPI0035DE2644